MSTIAAQSHDRSLADLEVVIERGLGTFVEVGAALLEIRDRRLYRGSHGDFDSYCRERWGFSRQRAHQMIEAADVVAQLSTVVDVTPSSERQARELGRVPPAQRTEVWERVVEQHGSAVTARDIREAANPSPPLLSIVDLETGEIVGDVSTARAAPRREVPELNVRPTRRIDDWEGAARERLKSEAQAAGRSVCIAVEQAHQHVSALIRVYQEASHGNGGGELWDRDEWTRAASLAEDIGRTIRDGILGGDGRG